MPYKIHPDKVYLVVFAILFGGGMLRYCAEAVADNTTEIALASITEQVEGLKSPS